MSLQGVLSDFGVADIFQLIAQQRKSGVLEIENGSRTLEVFFFEGAVVKAAPTGGRPQEAFAEFLLRTGAISEPRLAEAMHVQEQSRQGLTDILLESGVLGRADITRTARLLTNETIFELFHWDEGVFRFRPGDSSPEEGLDLLGAESVLLDALRMKDEWPALRRIVPGPDEIVVRVAEIEDFRERCAELEEGSGMDFSQLQRIYTVVDGRLSVQRVVDLSGLGTFIGTKGLAELTRQRIVRLVRPARTRSSYRATSGTRWPRPGLSTWVLGVALFVAVSLVQFPFFVRASHYPFPADGIDEARHEAAAGRIRTALEAHRWATGRYPPSLDMLAESTGPLLAGLRLGQYIYTVSSGGYTLDRTLP